MRTAALAAGITEPVVRRVEVAFPNLTPADLVAWRLGMAHTAEFVINLDATGRAAVTQRALELLGEAVPVLVRRMIALVATQR
jgi:hypothetical protein